MFLCYPAPKLMGDFRVAIGETFGGVDQLLFQDLVVSALAAESQKILGIRLGLLPVGCGIDMLLVDFLRQPLGQRKIASFDSEIKSLLIFGQAQ